MVVAAAGGLPHVAITYAVRRCWAALWCGTSLNNSCALGTFSMF